jgi:peroxiredoxin
MTVQEISRGDERIAAAVGQPAPLFELRSVQGQTIRLTDYQDQRRLILWFSRGFQCHFCRGNMERISTGYEALVAHDIELIQVAPNLPEAAQIYFANELPIYPFVCDPDKRLFAIFGLGDEGILSAARNTIISLVDAKRVGEAETSRWALQLEAGNRTFLQKLHHHALTAVEQGIFIIDRQGIIRYQMKAGSIEAIPTAQELLQLTLALT